MREQLLQVLAAALKNKGLAAPKGFESALEGVTASAAAEAMAESLLNGEQGAILLGNAAMQVPNAADLMRIGQALAQVCDIRFGVIGESASSAQLARSMPPRSAATGSTRQRN